MSNHVTAPGSNSSDRGTFSGACGLVTTLGSGPVFAMSPTIARRAVLDTTRAMTSEAVTADNTMLVHMTGAGDTREHSTLCIAPSFLKGCTTSIGSTLELQTGAPVSVIAVDSSNSPQLALRTLKMDPLCSTPLPRSMEDCGKHWGISVRLGDRCLITFSCVLLLLVVHLFIHSLLFGLVVEHAQFVPCR
jgi:hypothetical protein